ncbi:uncharacterized protein LOC124955018 [Vespa velutina]|uniref:uncharacterized protein LOC124955018 n=1 Tax=Vespa velutina TaxID=202808 RepID=UPI001FB534ED|nr:uncharacterized protein LOC124955018 [Vespa velutina]
MDKHKLDIQGNQSRYVATPEMKKKNVSNNTSINVASSSGQKARINYDFIHPNNLFQKKKTMSRHSMLPSHILLESSKEEEARTKDMELKLLYNDYLQVIMLEHLTKNKSEDMKKTIIRQLADIARECASDEEKLLKLKTRERDIMHLSIAQTELDAQIEEINEYIRSGKIDSIKDIMSHLCSVLEPLDQLRCKNIILPEKTEEWLELEETLKECKNTLQHIRELINNNLQTYQAVYNGMKDFTTTYNDIETCQKKLDEALSHLQVIVLKHGSFSLK